MDKNPLITIIVPVYNVKQYLSQCLDSVIGQTYRNLEIIVVDDGSTDGSSVICDDYKGKNNQIKVIHKNNGGLSDARNEGIKLATGEYITFVDSDDVLSDCYVNDILSGMVSKKVDVGIADYIRFYDTDKLQRSGVSTDNDTRNVNITYFSAIECLKKTYKSDIHGLGFMACGKIYKKELFINNNIMYPVGKVHEDIYTIYKLLYFARGIYFIDKPLYYYRVRGNSIMNGEFGKRNLVALDATRETCAFFEEHNESDLLTFASNYHIRLLFTDYKKMRNGSEFDKKDLKEYRMMMKADVDKYIYKGNMSLIKKIVYKVVSRMPIPFILNLVVLR